MKKVAVCERDVSRAMQEHSQSSQLLARFTGKVNQLFASFDTLKLKMSKLENMFEAHIKKREEISLESISKL